jgi:predicted amidohydrolase YtcJ
LTAVPATISPALPVPTLAAGEVADTILVNGNIVTMDAKRSTVKALAIKDGFIVAVGDDQAVRAMADADTKVIDATGRTVTPGMIDAH